MSSPHEKMKRLERRYVFLQERIKTLPPAGAHHDRAEASALRWALDELDKLYPDMPDWDESEFDLLREAIL